MLSSQTLMRLVPVATFLAIIISLGVALGRDPKQMPSQLIDKAVPEFTLQGLVPDVPGLRSADLGPEDDVRLVNIFASWCPGCRVEHPTLLRIAKEKIAPLYAINWKDKPGQGAKWLAAQLNPYSKIGEDASGRTGIELGVTGVPETFVIDKSGRIRYRHAGPLTDEIWAATVAPLVASLRKERR